MLSTRNALMVLAGLLLVVGAVVGARPHSINNHDPVGEVNCGSAFITSGEPAADDLGARAAGVLTDYEGQCADALSTPRAIGLSLVGVGVLGLLFVGLTTRRKSPSPIPAPPNTSGG